MLGVEATNPLQRQMGTIGAIEPLVATAKHVRMARFVGEIEQRFDRLPNRHVDENVGAVECLDRSRVSRFALRPPDEAGIAIGQSIDRIELGDEIGHAGIIDRETHPRDVDLSDVIHEQLLSAYVRSKITNDMGAIL